MRGRVLAGVIAAAAIMAKVREIAQIAGRELPPQFNRGKNSAISLAITAGVTDFYEAPGLRFGLRIVAELSFSGGQLWPPLFRRFGRKRRRWPCPRRQYSPDPKYCRP